MIVRSVSVGSPVTREYQGKMVSTGFFKAPVAGPLYLGKLGFAEDAQVDRVHHGGPDKAALIYAHEHYAYWQKELGRDPGPSAMAENLTVEGLTEESVCLGDVYAIGEAVVQVSQPRVPCYKTVIRHGVPDMVERVTACGYTGFYVRVLQEGNVCEGDSVRLVSRPEGALTVAFANRVMHFGKDDREANRKLLAVDTLADVWKEVLRRRLGDEG